MIFYEFLKFHLNKRIDVALKNGMKIAGDLKSVDPFLNIKLSNVGLEPKIVGLKGMDICSVRGSSIKWIDLEKNSLLDAKLSHATLLKFSLDK